MMMMIISFGLAIWPEDTDAMLTLLTVSYGLISLDPGGHLQTNRDLKTTGNRAVMQSNAMQIGRWRERAVAPVVRLQRLS